MAYYKDNPNIEGLSVITTINGDKEYRINCKFINGEYCIKEKDCYVLNGVWVRRDDKNIVFDWENKCYVNKLNTRGLRAGIIRANGQYELGIFTENTYNNVVCRTLKFGKRFCLSEEILNDTWIKNISNGEWYLKSEVSNGDIQNFNTIQNIIPVTTRGYNIEDNPQDFEQKVKLYENYKFPISNKVKMLSKFLGNITFGVEFEVARGYIPYNIQARYGVVPVRDGSLKGGWEMVTIPQSGVKGVQSLINLCDELTKATEIDLNCSLHIHFGNIPKDKLSIISLYLLSMNIQDDLFSMFPYFKQDPRGVKEKNYTNKLKKLNIYNLKNKSKGDYECFIADTWKKLFSFYSEDIIQQYEYDSKERKHPAGDMKWKQHSRYFYFNLMNMFYTHRNTAEARLHTGTTNPDKVINWLLINIAIIKYSQKYAKHIITGEIKPSLEDVLNYFQDSNPKDYESCFLSRYLINYYHMRRDRCQKDFKNDDWKSLWDITEDKSFKYSFEDRNLIR